MAKQMMQTYPTCRAVDDDACVPISLHPPDVASKLTPPVKLA